eukprot:4835238-Pyramimonas_sp.AAC.1
MPREILSDVSRAVFGWQDVIQTPAEQDSAGAEFARAHRVREAARWLALEASAGGQISKAS